MSKFTEYKDSHKQMCCEKKLTTLEDYFGGGSHYWHLECETCKTQYVYDTYERKLREYPKNYHYMENNINNYGYIYSVMRSKPYPSSYIGLLKEDALKLSKEDGWNMHVFYEDGVNYPMSASLCYDRFSAYVNNNVVTSTGVIG